MTAWRVLGIERGKACLEALQRPFNPRGRGALGLDRMNGWAKNVSSSPAVMSRASACLFFRDSRSRRAL